MERHHKTIRYCYVFLIKFCRQNPVNQAILYEYLEDFLLDINKNVFALTLITEIFHDNLKLCIETPYNVLRAIINAIEETQVSGKKAQLLNSL